MAKIAPIQRIPTIFARLEQRRGEHAARVVDEDRRDAQFGCGALQRRIDLLTVSDIGHDAEAADGFRGRCARLDAALPDGDRSAERREPFGDTAADALSPAGYDRHATGEQDVGRIDGHRD